MADYFVVRPSGQKNNVLFAIIAVVALLVAFLIFQQISRSGKVKVDLIVAPPIAMIQVDGKSIRGKTVYVSAGQHSFRAVLKNFNDTEKKVNVTGDTELALLLTPQNDEAEAVVKKYRKQYLEAEGLSGAQAQERGLEFKNQNPILNNLPHKTSYYSIDYRVNESGKLIVQITASTALGRQVALEKIRSWGFEPTIYNFEFIGLSNPFGNPKVSGGS